MRRKISASLNLAEKQRERLRLGHEQKTPQNPVVFDPIAYGLVQMPKNALGLEPAAQEHEKPKNKFALALKKKRLGQRGQEKPEKPAVVLDPIAYLRMPKPKNALGLEPECHTRRLGQQYHEAEAALDR
ncbi:MAG: hypothetical protein KGJ06_03300 [Pseudomonadota bacterium]|nr:hypothetical protein [Pseudomonadota bacterium]